MKGISMTYIKLLLVVLVFAAFLPMAHSQDDTFLLNHKEIGNHQRPLVEFNHKLHAENKLDCTRCHHDFDAFLNNRGGEGQTCDSCHNRKPMEASLRSRMLSIFSAKPAMRP